VSGLSTLPKAVLDQLDPEANIWACRWGRPPVLVFPDDAHSERERRLYALGQTDAGRLLLVTFTFRRLGKLIRVISARDMSRKERRTYPMLSFLRRRFSHTAAKTAPEGPLATHDDIRACFRLLMGRPPSPEEWPGYSSFAGRLLEDVVRMFLKGKGFQDRGLMSGVDIDYVFADVDGVAVAADPKDLDVGMHLLAAGTYEPHVSAVFRRELKAGMHVFDVGANIGYFTALALACVGPTGHVWAVEPNTSNVRLLEIARRANKVKNLSIVPAAAGDTFGPLRLDAPFSNGMVTPLGDTKGDLSGANIVCQIPLDSLLDENERVDFIKLDVEGSEYRALRGLERALDRWSPMIVLEFSPGMLQEASSISGRDFLKYMLAKGYAVGAIGHDGAVTFHDAVEPIIMAYQAARVDHIDLFATRTATARAVARKF